MKVDADSAARIKLSPDNAIFVLVGELLPPQNRQVSKSYDRDRPRPFSITLGVSVFRESAKSSKSRKRTHTEA